MKMLVSHDHIKVWIASHLTGAKVRELLDRLPRTVDLEIWGHSEYSGPWVLYTPGPSDRLAVLTLLNEYVECT